MPAEVDKNSEFKVRVMQRVDLQNAYRWSIEEGWNVGKHDHDVFFATDPNGFFVGELNGEPIGSVSGVAYDDKFGFVGIYILRPEFRGQGYGIQIFQAAMEYLGNRCVGLDGVIAQQDNYRRSGFKFEYRNIRFRKEGVASTVQGTSPSIVSATGVPFNLLADYDARHFPARRESFLTGWIREPEATAITKYEDGVIKGFGMVRAFAQGWCVGPLFADTPEIADELYRTLSAEHPGEDLYLDVPEVNEDAIALANGHQMAQVFETARMYTGDAPKLPLKAIYGVTSFELG